jgi:hypothetical protein
MEIIYLAVPYSHPDPVVRECRFIAANRIAAKLMKEGKLIFSPISHSHNIDLGGDWKRWEQFDRIFLELCSSMVVLCLPGWEESVGVRSEIKIMKELGKEIEYLDQGI